MPQPNILVTTTGSNRDARFFDTRRSSPALDTLESVLDDVRRRGIRNLLIERPLLRSIRDGLLEGGAEILRGDIAGTMFILLRREGPS